MRVNIKDQGLTDFEITRANDLQVIIEMIREGESPSYFYINKGNFSCLSDWVDSEFDVVPATRGLIDIFEILLDSIESERYPDFCGMCSELDFLIRYNIITHEERELSFNYMNRFKGIGRFWWEDYTDTAPRIEWLKSEIYKLKTYDNESRN